MSIAKDNHRKICAICLNGARVSKVEFTAEECHSAKIRESKMKPRQTYRMANEKLLQQRKRGVQRDDTSQHRKYNAGKCHGANMREIQIAVQNDE